MSSPSLKVTVTFPLRNWFGMLRLAKKQPPQKERDKKSAGYPKENNVYKSVVVSRANLNFCMAFWTLNCIQLKTMLTMTVI